MASPSDKRAIPESQNHSGLSLKWVAAAALVALVFAGGLFLIMARGSGAPEAVERDDGAATQLTASCERESDGVLTFAGLLPYTGRYARSLAATAQAAELAVEEVNAAGGVLGQDVSWAEYDTIGDPARALALAQPIVDAETDVVIGAVRSPVSAAVRSELDENCVIQISPGNTLNSFTTDDPNNLYFRTSPTDEMQGQVMAEIMIENEAASVAVINYHDDYANGVADGLVSALEDHDPPIKIRRVVLSERETTIWQYDSSAAKVAEIQPDALAIIGYRETDEVLAALFDQGIDPDQTSLYVVDTNMVVESNDLESGALQRATAVLPKGARDDEFLDRIDGEGVLAFAAEAYDAVIIAALAAEAASSDRPAEMAVAMVEVTTKGEPCYTFEECQAMLGNGNDIDYEGQSGRIEFTRQGDIGQSNFTTYSYNEDNSINLDEPQYRTLTAS